MPQQVIAYFKVQDMLSVIPRQYPVPYHNIRNYFVTRPTNMAQVICENIILPHFLHVDSL